MFPYLLLTIAVEFGKNANSAAIVECSPVRCFLFGDNRGLRFSVRRLRLAHFFIFTKERRNTNEKIIALLLILCLCVGLCACADEKEEDNTCVNCDNTWEVEHEGKHYCTDCYNEIPGVDRICVNCGGYNDNSYHNTCDKCYEEMRDKAHELMN